jgi:hypothetical protein
MPEHADWVRAGIYLQEQRVRLNPAYRNRSLFSRERGINYRLSQDIENAVRDNFDRPTITHIELAYGLEPGAVEKMLAGERPQQLPPYVAAHWDNPVVRQMWNLPGIPADARMTLIRTVVDAEDVPDDNGEQRRKRA